MSDSTAHQPPTTSTGGAAQKYGLPSPYDLGDTQVKLVAYTLVSIRRDHERVLPQGSGTVMVTDSMTAEAFAAWRITEYLQSDDYHQLEPADQLQEGEHKDLRVDFVVSRRWPRQDREYEKRKLETLRDIGEQIGQL